MKNNKLNYLNLHIQIIFYNHNYMFAVSWPHSHSFIHVIVCYYLNSRSIQIKIIIAYCYLPEQLTQNPELLINPLFELNETLISFSPPRLFEDRILFIIYPFIPGLDEFLFQLRC